VFAIFNIGKMKKILLAGAVVLCSYTQLDAQQARYKSRDELMDNLELSAGIGMVNFLGELGGANDIGRSFIADFEFDALRPNFQIGARFRWNRFLASKAFVQYGWITGNDAWTRDQFRNSRNLYFRSHLLDFGSTMEFYFLPQLPTKGRYKRRGLQARQGRPVLGYISTGVTGFWFDPTAVDANGVAHSLQPLGTEGQFIFPTRSPYNRVQIAIPIGLGFQFRLSDDFSLDVEISYRKTFTDYIDDVSMTYVDKDLFSNDLAAYFMDRGLWQDETDPGNPNTHEVFGPGQQRGNPQDNDAILYMNFSLTWKLGAMRGDRAKYHQSR
jgi:hypothetical protein